jgi:hypothetical protein
MKSFSERHPLPTYTVEKVAFEISGLSKPEKLATTIAFASSICSFVQNRTVMGVARENLHAIFLGRTFSARSTRGGLYNCTDCNDRLSPQLRADIA